MKKQFKHIAVGEEIAERFDKLKIYPRETDEEVLIRIMDNLNNSGGKKNGK